LTKVSRLLIHQYLQQVVFVNFQEDINQLVKVVL